MKLKKTRLRAWKTDIQRKVALCCAIAGILSASGLPVSAQVRTAFIVQSDRGGWLGQRSKEIRKMRADGLRVELRGTCLSACTMYLSLPNACVSSNAIFGFHGPTRNGQPLSQREFDHWSGVMADNYKEPLRSWFLNEARYRTSGYYKIAGTEIIRMGYTPC